MPRRAICLLILFSLLVPLVAPTLRTCAADDIVTLRPASLGSPAKKVRGTVIDYTGTELILQTLSGQTSIPADKVDQVETNYPESYRQGKKLLLMGQSSEAIRAFETAAATETRPWVRREIWAMLSVALHNAGRIPEAGNVYLKIVAEDPQTIHVDVMPLAWFSLPPNFERDRAARGWMQSSQPQAQLIGASWLLGTSDRSQAISTLGKLRSNPSPTIAMLADALLWPSKIVTATPADLRQWQHQLDAGILRGAALAGPNLVIGKGWRQLGNNTQAALTLMRQPILYPEHRPVAAESLLQAGRALQSAGQTEEATRVLREALDKYGDQPARQEAETILKQIANSGSN
ncbi:tetratricopeptide repeat protein [bacterium]|nr:tetratricopeptide repeat protein [bacterium]